MTNRSSALLQVTYRTGGDVDQVEVWVRSDGRAETVALAVFEATGDDVAVNDVLTVMPIPTAASQARIAAHDAALTDARR